MKSKISSSDFNFTKEVEKRLDLDTSLCYQCGKCTAGCPVAYLMDHPPNQIIHLVQLGMKEKVLESRSIFLCVTCGICSERCPREVKIAELMNGLKGIAKEEGYGKKESEIVIFDKVFLEIIREHGRLFEAELVPFYNLLSGHPLAALDKAPHLVWHHKLNMLPERPKSIEDVRKMFENMKKEIEERKRNRGERTNKEGEKE